MSKGFAVSMPLLDASVYDCILDSGSKLFKIQIKAIYQKAKVSGRDKWKIGLRRSGGGYSKDDVDVFAIYVAELDGFFIIPNNQQTCLVINIKGKYRNNFNNFTLFY